MKKTLKRELKLFEIVESDAFVVSVSAFTPPFLSGCMQEGLGDNLSFLVCAGVSKAGGFASWRQLHETVTGEKVHH